MTFDPTSPNGATSATIDSDASVGGVACPTTSECTAVDGSGHEVTFDPAAPAGATPVTVDNVNPLTGVACPSTSLCVAGAMDGYEVAFNPVSPATPSPTAIDAAGQNIEAVACTSVSACVAVDRVGGAIPFDPSAPGLPLTYLVDPAVEVTGYIDDVACPSPGQCTAVDTAGNEITFDPSFRSPVVLNLIDTGPSLYAIACPSSSQCVTVDNAGSVIAGNFTNPRSAMLYPIAPNPLTALACASIAECVVVDSVGNAYIGLSAPVTTSPPAIAGLPDPGQILAETHGSWLGTPTRYAYQWQRCDINGLTCAPIPGATAQTYTVIAADAGATLRVQETATNAIGTSGAATSTPTAPVTAPSSGGGGGSPPSSPPPPGTKPPVITGYRITNDGTVFKYTLSEAASVTIAISQLLPGRRRGRNCLAPTRKLPHAGACTRTIHRRRLTHNSHQGANVIGLRPLKPGRYQATITATGSDGQTSAPRTVTFTAVP